MSGFDSQERVLRDYQLLLDKLPIDVRDYLEPVIHETEEVKMRYGRELKIKHGGKWVKYPLIIDVGHLTELLSEIEKVRDDNRAGIDGTGHRISRVPGADGESTDGYTIRVARFYTGIAEVLREVLHEDPSLLITGKAGKGKSTTLRDICRIIAEKYDANVSIVDTSNEVAGDGRIPHPGIGEADRYFVPVKARQHEVMLEVIANNSAHIVVIDEVQTKQEADTIRDLSVKAKFVATTHGDNISQLLENKSLSAMFYPEPIFKWCLVIREIGLFDLYDLATAIEEIKQGREPLPLKTFNARVTVDNKMTQQGGGNEEASLTEPAGTEFVRAATIG